MGRWLANYTCCKNPVLHWRQRLALAFLQAQRASFSTPHLRWLTRRVSTGAAIQRYCDRHGIPHNTVTLDATSTSHNPSLSIPPPTLHVLTPKAPLGSGSTLLYFHGGGYVNPLRGAAHMPFIIQCSTVCHARQVVILEYSLAPEHPYPAQLVQCVSALRHLIEDKLVEPGDVILAGDSAGGQLVGALLAHLARPSPYAAPLIINGQFRAALLVSPFTRLPTDAGSYDSNDGKDYLNRVQVAGFKAAWKGREDEAWANLCGGENAAEIWKEVFAKGTGGLVKKVMVTVGTAEVFLDCCRFFAKEHVGVETVVAGRDTDWRVFEGKTSMLVECEGEVHVQVALDFAVGYDKGTMTRAVMSWLATTNSLET